MEAGRPCAVLVSNYQSTDTAPYPTSLQSSTFGIITPFWQIIVMVYKALDCLRV
jgi:hypothetical protein